MKQLRQTVDADFDQMLRIFRCHGVMSPDMRPALHAAIFWTLEWASARLVAPRQDGRGLGRRSGLFHLSARLQPALEAAEIAHVGITHFLEGLADER